MIIGCLIGADPDQLESLGTTSCRQRECVESIGSLVTSTLAGTAWVGPARQVFESDWESSFRSALSRLSDAFDRAGRDRSARAIFLLRVMGRMQPPTLGACCASSSPSSRSSRATPADM